jgi:hypothetical protein
MAMSKAARVYLAVVAVIVAAAVPAGLLSAGGSAGASTSVCGDECTSPSVESLGTGDVLTAEGSSAGSSVKLSTSTTSETTDWTIEDEYGVPNAVSWGVISNKLEMLYADSYLIEIQYAPDGDPSNLCLSNTSVQLDPNDDGDLSTIYVPTQSVALEPCGITAQSLWIIDQSCALDTYCDLINAGYEAQYTYLAPTNPDVGSSGVTSPFAEPYVLTASSSGALSLAPLAAIGGNVPASQAWTAYTSPDQAALRAAIRKMALKARNTLP